ncbi:winged helix-turn-helix transcriptional regulator [Rikenella microfusus]|uniref:HTH-type transcriptional activator hxlR n=1 Tax=Rikenella microfusus TaxID=28139 RepID=A0A379MR96_9BACT|nr:helix-turn-helix domain-containing protein [Rikenella microfusus]SUE33367.1 HTH-type transcriptional activator hxlR [Rikenella microfusus]
METPRKRRNFPASADCPIRNVLARLGEKWPMLVLVTLHANGTMRFGEIRTAIGDISQRMLTVTLRTLVEDGLVGRTAYPEVPPRVEYRLTPTGLSLMPHIDSLVGWATEHLSAIQAGRDAGRGGK